MAIAEMLTRAAPSDSPEQVDTCPFCPALVAGRVEYEFGTVAAFRDGFPVTEGHYLIVPLRHAADFFAMTDEEREDTNRLLVRLRDELQARDATIRGFNIGMNCGEFAGQTVSHAHTHLIPRREGDTASPRGGVRGVIPSRMSY